MTQVLATASQKVVHRFCASIFFHWICFNSFTDACVNTNSVKGVVSCYWHVYFSVSQALSFPQTQFYVKLPYYHHSPPPPPNHPALESKTASPRKSSTHPDQHLDNFYSIWSVGTSYYTSYYK